MRTALVNRLRASRAPVTLVEAPAGYGKTTLLGQRAARETRDLVWLRIDRGDDAEDVVAGLAEAVARIRLDGAAVEDALAGRTAHSAFQRVARLLAAGPPLLAVLDQLEHLPDEAIDGVVALCGSLPQGSSLILSGRSVPAALSVARLRAEGRLAELAVPDLRFSDREALALLRTLRPDVTAEEAAELNARAEGWPAGLYLSAVAAQPRAGHPSRSLAGVDGTNHVLSGYLDSEVAAGLSADLLSFARRVSLLARMDGPTCDAVLGTHGSGARLRRLAGLGAFMQPVDREHDAFRFHPFLRDTLRRRLEQDEHAVYVELSRRAADLWEQRGDVATAIEYIRTIEDPAATARLLGEGVGEIVGRGMLVPAEECLDQLEGTDALARHADAAVAGAFVHAFRGNVVAADRWQAVAAGAGAAQPTRAGRAAKLSPAAHVLDAAICHDGYARMRDDAAAGADAAGERSPVRALALLLHGVAELLARDGGAAHALFVDARDAAVSCGAPLVEAMAEGELALLALRAGEWRVAEEHACAARSIVEELGVEGHPAAALPYVASAQSALRHANWVRAGADVERVELLLPRLTDALPWLSAQVRLELARVQLALNDAASAAELAAAVESTLLARPLLGALVDDARELRDRLDEATAGDSRGGSLTRAELRLLPLLTTHLTFRQIAQHLYLSRNTIKTQAISVYRKLGVTSRTEAIERAMELGLLRPGQDAVDLHAEPPGVHPNGTMPE